MSPPGGGRSRLYPLPSREGRLPVSESHSSGPVTRVPSAGKWYTPAIGPGRRAPPGGAGGSALPPRLPDPRGRSPPAAPPAAGLQGKRRGGVLPAGHARAAPFAWCISLGWSRNKAAAARSRNLACPLPPPAPAASVRVPARSWAMTAVTGPSRHSESQHLHCTGAGKGTLSFASVPAGFRHEALLTNFVDAAFTGIQLSGL